MPSGPAGPHLQAGTSTGQSRLGDTSLVVNSGATTATPNGDQTAAQAANVSPEAARPAALRLTIRAGPEQKVLLAVPPSKTVLSVIKHFLRKFDLDQTKAGQCKLLFDNEEIEHDLKLGETEVEDEDTLDIKVPS